MNILLTGANGFIGTYFINKYKDQYNIRTFSFLKDNFNHLKLNDIDLIIHLSALVHQMNGAKKDEYEKVNIVQTIDLAKKAKNNNVKHFIFMSTIAVYGIEEGFIKEESPCHPVTEYGKSKLKAEQELLKLEDDNFKVTIIRPPIVNGYNAPGNMKSLIHLVKKVPILPFKSINNRRSMIYVGNLVYFIETIINKQSTGIFLVADGESLSTTKLIELIAGTLGKKIYLVKIPFFASLLKVLKPSFHKRLFLSLEINNKETVHKLFGSDGNPLPYSVEEGIKLMIEGEQK